MAYPYSALAVDKTNDTVSQDDHAPHHDALGAALNTLLTELGSGPRGASADLTTRLALLATTAAVAAGYQPLDSDLTAIAALSTTSFGRALLVLADAAALRTAAALGTAATTDTGTSGANVPTITLADARYQPLDSDLTAVAALSTTSYGRAFLALADAAAGRTALGLGTAAVNATGDFQPIDSDLTSIAALSTTAYGRAFLALANNAALLAVLGTGSPGATNFLRGDGSWQAASVANVVTLFAHSEATTTIVGQDPETNLFSVTIAGTPTAGDTYEATADLRILNHNGFDYLPRLRGYFGSTTYFDTSTFTKTGNRNYYMATVVRHRLRVLDTTHQEATTEVTVYDADNNIDYYKVFELTDVAENLATSKTWRVALTWNGSSDATNSRAVLPGYTIKKAAGA